MFTKITAKEPFQPSNIANRPFGPISGDALEHARRRRTVMPTDNAQCPDMSSLYPKSI